MLVGGGKLHLVQSLGCELDPILDDSTLRYTCMHVSQTCLLEASFSIDYRVQQLVWLHLVTIQATVTLDKVFYRNA